MVYIPERDWICSRIPIVPKAKWICFRERTYSNDIHSVLSSHIETVVLLGRKKSTEDMVYAYVDYEPEDDAYLQGMKGNATYREIKEWIKAEYGMSVSSLYVAQIKDKCGFEKRQNYNIGENKAHVPNCPPEKEKAILKAFKHFRMI